uniref:2-iminobutanoate/2-iminopropanoate deaminase-like isoform X2 n=2 Tax=Petromyzon marinus TaxID=7757 RepID=A0AAJ7TD88_PETMA|nr:2-iminobutanoate/2-iminopropanoate deaminase-like isoform X2 [Petromyzon marinus]XP_032815280.1 2-iminobutanoate/2-iminopropanoate deaminase-like isoform X2 [Petromyzon marinus]XP_032815282.1 2-iminobutanoate/2-iminopropanoate deaminase-like isoform X2 [Petromyzon marinus]
MDPIERRIVNAYPNPLPYSQAVQAGRTLYVSGQVGLEPGSGLLVHGGTGAQARQALKNIGMILKGANCDYKNVVKTTVLLADMKDFSAVNEAYAEFFSSRFPARAAYQVMALPRGASVEIEAVAVLGPISEA